MELQHGRHLAYCTNIHRGETWAETFASLEQSALAVRDRVSPHAPYAIGLRLSHTAALELEEPGKLLAFQRWLDRQNSYVFTINGFPYGQFHGTRVKEQVYAPDWTTPERLTYTNRLCDLLAAILPPGMEGSVSTLPGSFKEFIRSPDQEQRIFENLWSSIEHIARLNETSQCRLQLALEPEPLGLLENTAETISFFHRLRALRPKDTRAAKYLGVNYDTCHFAVAYEEPRQALAALKNASIPISKIHLSSALKTAPTPGARAALKNFADDVYLHQVVARDLECRLHYYRDLPEALAADPLIASEWRIHFHVPLHAPAGLPFQNTNDHLLGALDWLAENPGQCPHLEMETYTWEVLPPELKSRSVVEQLVAEYDWTLVRLAERGLARR